MPQEEIVTGTPAGNDQPGADGNKGDGDPNKSATGPKPAGQDPADKTYSFKEDRSDWVPRHRLSEAEKRAADRATKELSERHRTEIEDRDRKLRILAGVESVDPAQADDAKVKAELERILGAGIGKLTPQFIQKLERAIEQSTHAEEAALRVWEDKAEAMISNVETTVAEALGADNLTENQSRTLRRAYRDAAEEAAWRRQNDPNHDASTDFIARHERGDKTLTKEIAEAFVKDWIEPVRRKVTSDATSRFRPVPRGERGRPLTTPAVKVDLSKPGSFEDAIARARSDEGRGYRE